MTPLSPQPITGDAWALARLQHDVIAHWQLRAFGYTEDAIRHRLRTGRLFALWRGVYAVGRPQVSRRGRWKAATLACGAESALDGESGLALWDVRSSEGSSIEVAVPEHVTRDFAGIRVRRVRGLADQVTEIDGIPVVSLPPLFVQLAGRVRRGALEAAINEADKKDLMHVEQLRREIEALRGRPGVATLRRVIDRATFRYSDSELERAMRPIIREGGAGRARDGRVGERLPGRLLVAVAELRDRDRRRALPPHRASSRPRTAAATRPTRSRTPPSFHPRPDPLDRAYVQWAVTKKARDLMQSVGDLYGVPTARKPPTNPEERPRRRLTSTAAMAVVIASDLGKDIAGSPLLRGVSFKLERRDRMTLSGRNGSGKTTLLRMLAGQAGDRPRQAVAPEGRARCRCTTSARRASATCRCATTCCRARRR